MSNKSAIGRKGNQRAGRASVKSSGGNLVAPEQVLELAVGIIRELLQHVTEDSSSDSRKARTRAENFLQVVGQ